MSIDKSLSQYYDVPGTKKIKGQLHKLAYITPKEAKALKKMGGKKVMTPEGIPAYPPQGQSAQHGGKESSSTSSSSSGGGGGEGRPHGGWSAPAPKPAPKPSGPPGGGDKGMTYKAPDPVRHHTVDTPIQIKEQIVLDEIREKEKEKLEADWDFEDAKVLYGAPKIIKPKPKTYERGVPWLEDELVKTVTPPKVSPTYYQDRSKIGGETWGERAEEGIKRGGIGTALKNVALGVLAPQLLAGTAFAKPYNLYRQYQTAKKYVPKIGDIETALKGNILDKKLSLASTQHLKNRPSDMPEHLGERGFRTRDETPKGGDGEATIAKKVAGGEDVVTKSINQYRGTEVEGQIASLVQNNLNKALRHYADMNSKIETGYTPNRQEMDVFKLLEHYLNQAAPKQQNVAYGGRIDKALTGRSRDI